MGQLLEVKVWGPWACFTRPEFKAERVSYDVMTPSAARGILEAIFWKPEFRWRVHEIWVLNPIRHMAIVRNEVATRQSASGRVASGGFYFVEDDRQQRHTLALKDVAYLIRADVELQPHATDPPAKYRDQFRRRVERGQYHHTPYLGVREFAAFFGPPDGSERPQPLSMDLGQMLLDVQFVPDPKGPITFFAHGPEGRHPVRGRAHPVFFNARLEDGILRVPQGPRGEG